MRTRAFFAALLALGTCAAGAVVLAPAGASSDETASASRASVRAAAFARESSEGRRRGFVAISGRGTRTGSGTSAAGSISGRRGFARASARVREVKLFSGLVTASVVRVSASAAGSATTLDGRVSRLTIDGRRVGSPSRARTYDLNGYGKLIVLRRSRAGITGLRARLTRRYRGHARGSWVAIAYASARAANGRAGPESREQKKRGESRRGEKRPRKRAQRRRAPELRRLRTGRGYAFPVRGRHRFSNDYGAPRQNTGSHVGNDIFARAGTPLVAVTDGRLFRVGTRRVPGNRLWLKGARGDTFFYAHMSAFAQDARNGLEVRAGDVVGFVGSTGDAEQTPPHLHFEVHPKGGDPVNPYPFLRAWQTRRDVPSAAWLERYGGDPGARPGALVVLHDFLEP